MNCISRFALVAVDAGNDVGGNVIDNSDDNKRELGMLANPKRPSLVPAICAALVGFALSATTVHAQKEQFERSKPHVNAGGKKKPQSLYFPETMLKKQKQKPKLKANSSQETGGAASGLPTGKRQHKPVSVTRPSANSAAPSLLDRGSNGALGGNGAAPVMGAGAGTGGGGSGAGAGAGRLTR